MTSSDRSHWKLTLIAAALTATACGASESAPEATPVTSATQAADQVSGGIRRISPAQGAEIASKPPQGLVVLDVRTPEEFAEGHLEGAIMVDFYEADFRDQLADLDPDVPYLLYCRSGNRSGQTTAIMSELGFTDVADVDGGIAAWTDAGLPTVIP